MWLSFDRSLLGLLLALLLLPGIALACDPDNDGCLGCDDDQLQECLKSFTQKICDLLSNPDNCDTKRVYDEAERNVMISTGRHMSRILTMSRSPRKYEYR